MALTRVIWLYCSLIGLVALPALVCSLKCYVCDSRQHAGCGDASQISQFGMVDCASTTGGSYFGANSNQLQGQQSSSQTGGFNSQQQTNNWYGGYLDRCVRATYLGQGQIPIILRMCGSSNGAQSDGCFWNGLVQTCTCNYDYCNVYPNPPTLNTNQAGAANGHATNFLVTGILCTVALLFQPMRYHTFQT